MVLDIRIAGADGSWQHIHTGNPVPVTAVASALPVGAAIAVNQRPPATAPTIYNIAMALANTEYSQVLPASTKRFSIQCHTSFDVRFAFVTGRVAVPVAPYGLVLAGMNYYEDGLNLTGNTVYVACPDAAKVAEIICWS